MEAAKVSHELGMSDASRKGAGTDHDVLVLLHGGGGSQHDMRQLGRRIVPGMKCYAFNLLGHGGRPVPSGCSMDEMADDLANNIRRAGFDRPFILGHCWGSLATLNMLTRYPGIVSGVVLTGLRFRFDARAIAQARFLASEDRVRKEGKPFAMICEKIHGPNWQEVRKYNDRMAAGFADNPPVDKALIPQIDSPVLLMAATEDSVAPVSQSMQLSRMIPGAKLVVFEGNGHPLSAAPLDLIASKTLGFCEEVRSRKLASAT